MSESERKQDAYRDERLNRLETSTKKLDATLTQLQSQLDQIDIKAIREDLSKALVETQKTISEACVDLINRKLSGQSTETSQTLVQSTGKKGGLDGIFDRIGPTAQRLFDKWADNAQLPFMQPQQTMQGIQSSPQFVDLERSLHKAVTLKYNQVLEGIVKQAYKDVGLPLPEAVKVGVSH